MRIPTATYRLQFHPEFGFQQAQKVIHYLAELGISDVYASPIFKARSGSSHGYDVVDPNQLNPELGSHQDFENLMAELHSLNMGWVQDIVPNHMAYNSENYFLMDILEHGPDSEYFDYFDIEWEHPYEDIKGKLLTPMLGDFYGNCLENGEIQLNYDENGLNVNYYDIKLPLRIESYATFLSHDLGRLSRKLGRSHPDAIKMLGILYIVKSISTDLSGRQRKDQTEFVKSLLWEAYNNNEEIKNFINHNLEIFNGEVGKPESFDLLDKLLSEQFFRLSFWKVGAEELNYRRFFTVNDLISLRVEDQRVFHKTHETIEKLVEAGKFTGLRIDHIDGLFDPTEYLRRLREKMGDIYVVAEKILELGEKLPEEWCLQGTSGYHFLNQANSVFCQTDNAREFTHIYRRMTGYHEVYDNLVAEKKRLIAETNLVGDVDNIARLLKRIAGQYRYGRDFTLTGLKKAILEVLVQFPIYCTYINHDGVRDRDRFYVRKAIQKAKRQIPQLVKELNLIEKFLLLDYEGTLTEAEREQWVLFAMRLQQFSGPLMAKGVEDTLFYVYNRLVSLNEVGGHPQQFGISLEDFHQFNREQLKSWPHAMNATSTHDTKRSEDVRARINVLSEIPTEWEGQVKRWRELNQEHKKTSNENTKSGKDQRLIPDANDEYFLYQNLVGVFPFSADEQEYADFIERIKQYAIKSVREAKVHTAWITPDTDYEEGFLAFIEKILDPSPDNIFLAEFRDFQRKIAAYGMFNSLSQTLLKIASPGVPDFYQGTELWNLSLVDPDNRRAVDYEERLSFLQEIKRRCQTGMESLLSDLKATRTDGRMKLFLIARGLQARQQYQQVFQYGDYIPLSVTGSFHQHVIAFARLYRGRTVIAIAPRFLTSMISADADPLGEEVWGDTRIELPHNLQSANWRDTLVDLEVAGGETLSVGKVLQVFPVALLVSEE
ncbi:malto-oligosyltrehalose synthase [Geitlerinema sp. PCC 9228]|uniref:malto-oligosyltrehalose synthase n=1 Tax=Geitlerinema sp. PCC 9228 TaxID=111611 RepID=UPI0008F9B1D0|nr:malto-oligosyltrehalose synthase [Geitlerinema sp. PCC 9228]